MSKGFCVTTSILIFSLVMMLPRDIREACGAVSVVGISLFFIFYFGGKKK
jgi:hypothetical protein